MATLSFSHLTPLFLFLFLFFSPTQSEPATSPKSSYIIHVAKSHRPLAYSSNKDWHTSLLHSLASPPSALLYSYSNSATGFSAYLTAAQLSQISRNPAVISVVPDEAHQLHTTRTPKFLGLADETGLWPKSNNASDVIIGVLDTGIWPEIRSFSDAGYDQVPSTWKGACEVGPDFPASSCNKKIIGARIFYKGYEASHGPINQTLESKSPRDTQGHGTHTASTAAGSVVPGAGLFGYAQGVARGMASKARIAAYKICWKKGCFDSDILAAMDKAIEDGVNIISLSVGGSKQKAYHLDSIAIGSLHAAQSGVLVSASAGNSGPKAFTAVNIAPWILTVGASTIDREFVGEVVLGDGRRFRGATLYDGDGLNGAYLVLVNGADCGSQFCKAGELNSSKVAGKMVICDRSSGRAAKGVAVKEAGGVGMILTNPAEIGEELLADSHMIPATAVGYDAGAKIKSYVSSVRNPTATIIFQGTVISTTPPAPAVATFSSRGPNHISPEILKPDVIAPGVNILAGWTGAAGPTDLDVDTRRVEFNIISGTSMSCPHVSGLAALLKNAHPEWSPAAIKSALMTTAYHLDNSRKNLTDLSSGTPSTPFVHGSGHVDPDSALDPGLVYDINVKDYIAFLCASGYDSKKIPIFFKQPVTVDCKANKSSNPGDLNYPSFSVEFEAGKNVVQYYRAVKNVGSLPFAVYRVTVNAPPNVAVSVFPKKLVFTARHQTLSYKITFSSTNSTAQSIVGSSCFGSIEWSDMKHLVSSPIAVRWVQATPQHLVASF